MHIIKLSEEPTIIPNKEGRKIVFETLSDILTVICNPDTPKKTGIITRQGGKRISVLRFGRQDIFNL